MRDALNLSAPNPQCIPFPISALAAIEVAEERAVLRQMLELAPERSVIAFSGGLALKDGAALMLEAAAALRARLSADAARCLLLYWILPEETSAAEVDRFVRDYAGRNSVSLPEFRLLKASSQNEFAAFHSIADVFVSASTSSGHGPELGLLYALARGRASVASTLNAAELAENQAALCFEPGRGQVLAMAHSAEAALGPALNSRLGSAARDYVSENLAPRRTAEVLKNLFVNYAARSAEQLEHKKIEYAAARHELLSASTNHREPPGVQESRSKILSRAAAEFSWLHEER